MVPYRLGLPKCKQSKWAKILAFREIKIGLETKINERKRYFFISKADDDDERELPRYRSMGLTWGARPTIGKEMT